MLAINRIAAAAALSVAIAGGVSAAAAASVNLAAQQETAQPGLAASLMEAVTSAQTASVGQPDSAVQAAVSAALQSVVAESGADTETAIAALLSTQTQMQAAGTLSTGGSAAITALVELIRSGASVAPAATTGGAPGSAPIGPAPGVEAGGGGSSYRPT